MKLFKNADFNLFLLIITLIYSQVLFDIFMPSELWVSTYWGVLGVSLFVIIIKYQNFNSGPRCKRPFNLACAGLTLSVASFSVIHFLWSFRDYLILGFS